MTAEPRERLSEVADAERRRLAGDPNVVAVGYGLRLRGGRAIYEACVQYYVKRKMRDPEDIRSAGSQPIPELVGGYPTDVIEAQMARPHRNDGAPTGTRGSHIENPLIGGVSTTVLSDWHSFPTGFGTLGGICFDRSNGDAMAISNAHVWGTDVGKDCIQPWMPTGEYLTAALKLLTCGPDAFILDMTAPSALTVGLSAAAAAAWVAAAASDAEDPSRWGQRTGVVPPNGVFTTGETIRVSAPVPDMPFAGRAYTTEARWDYTRRTADGMTSTSIAEQRKNEQVLVGKLAWTARDTYRPGERVRICAEVISERIASPQEFFVVAQCYPNSHPDRLRYRVLRPGRCEGDRESKPICVRDFPDPPPSGGGSGYTIDLDPFRFESREPAKVLKGPSGTPLQGQNVLQVPATPLRVVFPPSTRVDFEVIQSGGPATIIGRNSAGQKVATVTGSGAAGTPETLVLEADELVEAIISGPKIARGSMIVLVSVCVSKRPGAGRDDRLHRLYYSGDLELDLQEQKDRWNIVLQVQSLDPSPSGSDPIAAAQNVGGIAVASNITGVGCVGVMLLDHVFDVI